MGVCLLIDKEAAIKAGLQLSTQPNGTKEEITSALKYLNELNQEDYCTRYIEDQRKYLNWLSLSSEVVRIPTTDRYVVNHGIGKDIQIDLPRDKALLNSLEQWLSYHSINWSKV